MILYDYINEKVQVIIAGKDNTKELRNIVKDEICQELLSIFSINGLVKNFNGKSNTIKLYSLYYPKIEVKCNEENNSPEIVENNSFRIDVIPSFILRSEVDPETKKISLYYYD